MADFTLIMSSGKNEETTFLIKAMRCFLRKASIVFKKSKPDDWIREVELYDNVNAYILDLPYSINELMHMRKKRVEDLVFSIPQRCKNTHLIFAENLSRVFIEQRYIDSLQERRFIFRALLITVLDEIYQKRGIDKSSLNITVIKGKSSEEFYAVVKLLSPVAKYITAVVENKEEISCQVNEIFEDTGLCIGITGNLGNVIKSTDVIINLSNDLDWIIKMTKNPSVIVINLAEQCICRIPCGNVIINGVHIMLPRDIAHKIGKDICDSFSELRLSETIILHKLDKTHIEKADFADHDLLKKALKEFDRCGFGISGFIGRYSSIKLDDVSLS
jgi:hypothetical protein